MRKQVIHILICFAAITIALSSCKKDGDAYMPMQYVENENSSEQDDESLGMEILSDEITKMIKGKEEITYEDIQEGIKDSPYIETSVVEDNMLYITLKDGMELQVDLYGVTIEPQDDEETDDSEINALLEDIQNALIIDENEGEEDLESSDVIQNSTTMTSVVEESNRMNSPQRVSANDPTRIISNNKVLLWAPNGADPQKMKSKLTDFCKKHSLVLESRIEDKCTLEDLNTFPSYGLVVIENHGNTRGQLIMPMTDYWKEKYRENKVNKKNNTGLDNGVTGKILTKNGKNTLSKIILSPIFPKLSYTIIWTCVCHAFHSESKILKNAKNADVAAFGGGNNTINVSKAMKSLENVGAKFYNKGKGGTDLSIAYGNAIDHAYEGGGYKMYIYNSGYTKIIYQNPQVASSRKNRPVGELYLPAGLNPYSGRKVKSYSQSVLPSQIEAGFRLYNKSTNKSTLVPYSTDDYVQTATWNNMITRYVITGNTDNYEAGEYTYKTYLKLGDEIIYSEQQYSLTIEKPLCPNSNHPHAIDLGIGVKFACCNVGASSPVQFGNYYEWKESQSAVATWGGGWRMPSLSELRLLSNCSHKWTSINGVNGMLFIGKNNNKIFLPAAGIRLYDGVKYAGVKGYYWASEVAPGTEDNGGYKISFDSNGVYEGYGFCYGYNLRPIAR